MTDPRIAQVVGEWRQNRRLRIGAMVVLLILGTQVALTLSTRRAGVAAEYARDAELLQRLAQASDEAAWPARADEAEARLAELRGTLPPARSDGLAQAELQAWLSGLASDAMLENALIRVETSLEVPDQPGIWQVIAKLDANVDPARVAAVARALAAAPWVRTERLEIQSGRQTRLSLVVRGYYRQDDSVGDMAAPPALAAPPGDRL